MYTQRKSSPNEPLYQKLVSGLSTKQLQAFYMVAQTLHFSKASKIIGITQSALSQRINILESKLGRILINRGQNSISLSDSGLRLLKYCKLRETFEQELLYGFCSQNYNSLSGVVRIGSFSSITRSVIMPIVNRIINQHPNISCEFKVEEMRNAASMLLKGEVEMVITQCPINHNGVKTIELGVERNYLLESKNISTFKDVYIDHESSDHFTEHFFSYQQNNRVPIFRNKL
ncbi:LysR family transcriptional regulator [Shewanella sp. D64]|uniref:LysR family transcriptional regulator n=1 Tax=unclassified Shewanella TaxID=196818 RepID=UPI0022BA2140|nr:MULTISPECIES: LysR family transcriptional regulator [unclassified Shewanella]MEC4727179.1 LysR family transcriptional regulator [Shewanella sp. D64]MEC4739204.1 LysR family transcriptional regulator [Shewanella sp. E94]WBJ95546.1 LysR family transcriptional regulator [Shewanella sp. MTB7]